MLHTFVTKLLRDSRRSIFMAAAIASALCVLQTASFASPVYHLDPADSVFKNAYLGSAVTISVLISTGSDSNRIDTSHQGTINAVVTGSGFSLLSSSTISYRGYSEVQIQLLPTSMGTKLGKLYLTSSTLGNDSIVLVGFVLPHRALQILVGGSDTLDPLTTTCIRMRLYNPNDSAVRVDSLTLLNYRTNSGRYTISDMPSLPFTIPGTDTIGFTLCVNDSGVDALPIGVVIEPTFVDSYGNFDKTDIVELFEIGRGAGCFESINPPFTFNQEVTDSTVKSFVIRNTSRTALAVTGARIDGTEFSFASIPYPDTIAVGGYDTLYFRYQTSGFQYAHSAEGAFTIDVNGINSLAGCTGYTEKLAGNCWDNVEDSTITNMLPDSTVGLSISSTHVHSLHILTLVNNSGHAVSIPSIVFSGVDSAFFRVVYKTPDTVATSGNLFLIVELNAPTVRTYEANLDLTIQNALTTSHFKINAVRKNATSGVAPIAKIAPHEFSVSPNPSHGSLSVAVPNAREANIEVYNLLGALVASQHATNWKWDEYSTGLPNGSYIVRVTGRDLANNPFTSSKMIVMEH